MSWCLLAIGLVVFCSGAIGMFTGGFPFPQKLLDRVHLEKREEFSVAVFLVGSTLMLIGILTT